MVPKQETINRDDSSDTTSDQPLFGSQLVDENSPTPYSDATQVRVFVVLGNYFFNFSKLKIEKKNVLKITILTPNVCFSGRQRMFIILLYYIFRITDGR